MRVSALGRAGILVALFLSALALRPQVIGLGPLLPEIQDDLDVSHAVAGLLATIPVLCMGLFAPLAPYLSARVGSRTAIAIAVGFIGAFGIARLLTPWAVAVVVLTVGVGIGIGVAGSLMPVAVKERFPHRPALATGVYTTGINVGSAVAAAVALPIAHAAGGWRSTFYVFSGITILLVGVWLLQTRRETGAAGVRLAPPRPPVRSRMAWLLVGLFGVMGVIFYGLNAWLADSFVERGWSEASAGALVAVFNLGALFTSLPVSWAADRYGSRRRFLAAASLAMFIGLVGVLLLPGGAWAWAVLMGAANGVLFTLVMTLPLDVAERPAEVGAVAGMMLGIGYSFAALAPFTLGGVRDLTGSFTVALWVLVAAAGLMALGTLLLSRERLRRGVGGAAIATGR